MSSLKAQAISAPHATYATNKYIFIYVQRRGGLDPSVIVVIR